MRPYIKLVLLAILFYSCDEATQLDLKQTPPRLVIEGLLTDRPQQQSVKISWSTAFYGTGQAPRINNATVNISDDTGEEYAFVHNPRNHADSVGIYVPEIAFAGQAGRTYTLHVTVEGELYQATDQLLTVIPVDSLKFQVNEDQEEDPEEPGKIYELLVFALEPQDEENYYLFKYYRNDSLVTFNPTDIYYSDDQLLAEKIDGIPSPVYYGANDKARIEVYSLTRRGYVFYNDLSASLNNDGGGNVRFHPCYSQDEPDQRGARIFSG